MSRDEIIQMAEDCGIRHRYYEIPVSTQGVVTVESCTDRLLKFAEWVRADEREACAKLCDHWPYGRDDLWSLGQAIRARGEK